MSPTGHFKDGLPISGAVALDWRIEMSHGDRRSRYLVDEQAHAAAAKHGITSVVGNPKLKAQRKSIVTSFFDSPGQHLEEQPVGALADLDFTVRKE
jgi:hypothetical protein